MLSQILYLNQILVLLSILMVYRSAPAILWVVLGLVFISQFEPNIPSLLLYLIIVLSLIVPCIRKVVITGPMIVSIKYLNLLPKISQTEKTVLRSGTVWVDGELFSGKPDFKSIFSNSYTKLRNDEKSFLQNEVEELCLMCCDEQIYKDKNLSPAVWKFLKEKKFFGMIIPKEYGGLGFSAYAHSMVIQKLASRSTPVAITAMVPNSLGPAELLLEYGTKKQQDYYLPRLAVGKEIPCFALTEPMAGSDATSIQSNGVLFKDEDGEIKIRLNWNKRYITLGAVATLIGLAFQLRDPDCLLGGEVDLGITCALIPHKTKGVRQGRRHDPLATPFINSPLNGEDVIIGMDAIIGDKEGLGKGWGMLMECLSAGRGISLPSTSTGGGKLVSRIVSSYSVLRQQFGSSIGKFEGVEEVLARIFSKTYILESMRSLTASSVDAGSKPAVVSAIAKYHSTEMFRQIVSDGMDILGGAAIIRGKRNLMANAYFAVPISITVEGANIMTRSLIHFGQGAIMCHPFVYKEIVALENKDLDGFDKAVFGHINHFSSNIARSLLLSLTRGHFHKSFNKGIIGKYEKKLAWASASFAVLADIAILKFAGNLKRKEKLNGRFGDILSNMYMAICVLRKFDIEGRRVEDEIMVEYAMKDLFDKMQDSFNGLWQNMFSKWIDLLFFPIVIYSKINRFLPPVRDDLQTKLVSKFLKSGECRDRLTDGIFIPKDSKNESLARMEAALLLFEKSQPIIRIIKKAIKEAALPKKEISQLLDTAIEKKIISKKDAALVKESQAAIYDVVQVDEYTLSEYKKL